MAGRQIIGIDEAERYHNPRDPGMQQIRQLLNSGYKAGMPAIRVTGDDLKPQAFDVYSPKILAAIADLEDVLASRCIAISMRRTDRKLTPFPADFDAAAIRHQLYTLALTHFTEVYRNYFERPKLHTFHNRSGELWSPLVALAAFFEEKDSVSGLLDAISRAAEWDEQVSEGKALSDREEAVLQALEVMTRNVSDIRWIKASALREEVAKLMAQPLDRMGNAQWIGHILKRLHLLDDARSALLARQRILRLLAGCEGKLTITAQLLREHVTDQVLIFTESNATVYALSHRHLIPALTHETKVAERKRTLEAFCSV